jgi:hypothetical protein
MGGDCLGRLKSEGPEPGPGGTPGGAKPPDTYSLAWDFVKAARTDQMPPPHGPPGALMLAAPIPPVVGSGHQSKAKEL